VEGGAAGYAGTFEEVEMDKPRHPQVIRPWKAGETKKKKWSAPPAMGSKRERGKKPLVPKHG